MKKRNLYIYAPNIHKGGGKTLLDSLLKIEIKQLNVILITDSRYQIQSEFLKKFLIKVISHTFYSRFSAEYWLKRKVKQEDIVLCFSNLPPLFNLKGRVCVFVHNRLLIENVSLDGFSFKSKTLLNIQRLWIRKRAKFADSFIVQTVSMKNLMIKIFSNKKSIFIIPFTGLVINKKTKENSGFDISKINNLSFAYVATGEPHKNHKNLINAWVLMAKKNYFPTLYLTIDRDDSPEIHLLINESILTHKIKIINFGYIPHKEIMSLYENIDALIFPSMLESFGIPLLEAEFKGLGILASELDYVRDIINPDQTFDPSSPISILRAIERYSGNMAPSSEIFGPNKFLDVVLEYKGDI